MTTPPPRLLTVTTPLGTDVLRPTGFTCREGVSRLFELRLDLVAAKETAVAFDRLLGQAVTVTALLPDGTKRHFSGVARSVMKGATDTFTAPFQRTVYRMVVVPKLWLLTQRRQSRIFQQLSVPDILKQVLAGLDVSYQLQGTYEPRDYCAQYRETDFAFASRLMEEEGIFYFFKHGDGQHQLVLGDAPVVHPDLPTAAALRYEPVEGGARQADRVFEWEKTQELTAGKLTLWDHSFELPGKDLEATSLLTPATVTAGTASHKLRVAANEPLELYDYPGEYAQRFDGVAPGGGDRAADVQKIFQDNLRTVNVRVAQEAARAITVEGASDCRQLVSGHKFTLANNGDADGAYVLTSVVHEARVGSADRAGEEEGFTYGNRFTCVPAALPYRPPRVTPRPFVHGCQTAVVVGPAGEEIFTDKYGRVKVQFHWDRQGTKDANSSCWVRVASVWAGRQWGAVHLPRVGQEVVVDFEEGDPDRPILVGSVYNADNMPPYTLPANKTQSGVKSRSTPQGADDMFNELRFEDKKGNEQVAFQAQKDLVALVKNDETRTVWHDRTTTVLNHDTRTVGGKDKDGNEVGGNDAVTVTKGNRTITVKEGNLATTVSKGSLTTTVSEGDETHEVTKGKQTVTVEGNVAVTVKTGNLTTAVNTGNHETTVKTGNAKLAVSAGKYEGSAAQEIALKVGGSTITITTSAIELKLGATSIKLSPSGVEIKGPTIKLEATGQAEIKSAMVKVQGDGMLQLKAPMTQLNGDGMLMAKGGITMIN